MSNENNSSAPLKTALPTDVEAFEHFVSDCDGAGIQYDGPSYEQGFLSGKVVGMDAAQAVAAQAAPAAVVVPDERAAFEKWARWCELDISYDTEEGCYVSGQSELLWQCWHQRATLSATPALPATEDSSAGDRADWLTPVSELLGHISDALPDDEFAKIDTAKWNAVSSLVGSNRTTPAQAEVQAAPVVLQMCSDLKPRTDSEKAAYLAGVADGRMYAERDADTAPQAQPADALEPIRQAIRDYHYALDTHKHGGVAAHAAVDAIETALDMPWHQGQEAGRRGAAGQEGGAA